MSEYKPVKGDRIQVVLETRVSANGDGCGCLCNETDNIDIDYLASPTVVSIKKIEPPVEVFGPGDRLRRLSDHRDDAYEITLGAEGYLLHFSDGSAPAYYKYHQAEANDFNSKAYELVYRA